MNRTAAWPLALVWVALIVYASLYPFAGWRNQGLWPWLFVIEPWPRWWTWFDLVVNGLGYMPLGFLLALSALRRRWAVAAFPMAVACGAALSFALESLQAFLPARVPSNADWMLNTAGTALGAGLAVAMERLGAIARWSRLRERWIAPDAHGALVLLALWPAALLFPTVVPLALGQVMERLEPALLAWLEGSPLQEWVPVRTTDLQPLTPLAERTCVALGLVAPVLLAFSAVRRLAGRVVMVLAAVAVAVGATALSAALTWGPTHVWSWAGAAARDGLLAGGALAAMLLPLPRRACAALLLVVLSVSLTLLNQAPAGVYLAHTLAQWEQGRFIHFHGLAQWMGWIWPYAALLYALARLSRREAENTIRA